MKELTPTQQKVFDFIMDEASAGRPSPTLREIASRFGYKSHRAAACHLDALRKKGFIESQKNKARALSIRPKNGIKISGYSIPLFGSIPAGFAQDREAESEDYLTVDASIIGFRPTGNTFALRVVGDSMIGRHICDGDVVIMEHGTNPRHGQIVAALIDGKSTLKSFVFKGNKSFLKAENPKYMDLIPSDELVIQGVFKALIRQAKE